MKISFRETLELDANRRLDVVAFAGFLSVYQTGMTFRDCVKAIMNVRGVSWIAELESKYPQSNDYFAARANRPKRTRAKKETPQDKTAALQKVMAGIDHDKAQQGKSNAVAKPTKS